MCCFFFFQAEDGIRDRTVTGVQTCALPIFKAACPTALPSTPTGRIEAMRQRLEAMLAAVRTVRPVLEKFFDSLNDEQKARFNRSEERRVGKESRSRWSAGG